MFERFKDNQLKAKVIKVSLKVTRSKKYLVFLILLLNFSLYLLLNNQYELSIAFYFLFLIYFIFYLINNRKKVNQRDQVDHGIVPLFKLNFQLFHGLPIAHLMMGPEFFIHRSDLPPIRTGLLLWMHLVVSIISKLEEKKATELHNDFVESLEDYGVDREIYLPWITELYLICSKRGLSPIPSDLSYLEEN